MVHFEAGPDRWRLGFKEAVLESFKFLRSYGFRCVRAEATFVRYETRWFPFRKRLFVNVYHARGGYDMGVEVGPCDDESKTVNLPWMLKWAGAPEAEACSGERTMFQAESKEAVQNLVPKLAQLVQTYAIPFLRGDPEANRAVREEIKRDSAAFVEKTKLLAGKRHQATLAWQAKDYPTVVALYESFAEDLMETETEKLAEAKKQLLPRADVNSDSLVHKVK